ncbi:GTPase IMAP family member 8 [Hoplias malabaricus]|uniref:GTPase IMAP family member 8 n=1 Tax=Hoplias malabaricus TaxID=27720 RepID=UPI00346290F7
MSLPSKGMSKECSGSPTDSPELRLILVGNMGCGKTLTANTVLGLKSSGSTLLSPSKECEVRRGVSEGRHLTLVETPRWYWSGERLESSVHRETERALSLTAPGPHAFLILVPVGLFTEMEARVPAQLEQVFGPGVLSHTLVLLTCGDYLLHRDQEQYIRQDDPGLKEMVERCAGRWHVINNRQPHDRQQVISLLEKVERMVQSSGGCYLPSALQSQVEGRVPENERELHRRNGQREEDRVDVAQRVLTQKPLDSGFAVFRSRSREETEEKVTLQQLPNGLHSRPSQEPQTATTGPFQRSSSFKLNKEGAILSLMSEKTEVKQSNQNYTNTYRHLISSGDPNSTELTASSPSSPAIASLSSSLGSTPSSSELRLVLLGQSSSGKSTAGNALLGREEFKLRKYSTEAGTQKCVKGTALIGNRQVTIVDTPDWLWSSCSPEEQTAHQSSCAELCSPGPHVFLLCVPVTHPAHSILNGLSAIEKAFGPEVLLKHTMVLFTYSDLLGGGGVEQYIAEKRPEMMELVEKCGDHYHILERKKKGGKSVDEILEKVEQLVKESRGNFFSSQQQPGLEKKWEDVARERATALQRGRGGEQLDEVDRSTSAILHSLKEVDEDEEEVNSSSDKPQEPVASSSSRLLSALRFLGGKVGEGAKQVPKPIAGGALLGGALGMFFGGLFGGAVGATAGSLAAEVGRRKYGKSVKTD